MKTLSQRVSEIATEEILALKAGGILAYEDSFSQDGILFPLELRSGEIIGWVYNFDYLNFLNHGRVYFQIMIHSEGDDAPLTVVRHTLDMEHLLEE